MIEVFKWVKGISKGDIDQVLEFRSRDRTRGNRYKLEKLRFRTDIGRYIGSLTESWTIGIGWVDT